MLVLYDMYRTRLGLRCISSGSQSDATVSAVDCVVLFHAISTWYWQSGASLSLHAHNISPSETLSFFSYAVAVSPLLH